MSVCSSVPGASLRPGADGCSPLSALPLLSRSTLSLNYICTLLGFFFLQPLPYFKHLAFVPWDSGGGPVAAPRVSVFRDARSVSVGLLEY